MRACMCAYKAYKLTSAKIPKYLTMLHDCESPRETQSWIQKGVHKMIHQSWNSFWKAISFLWGLSSAPVFTFIGLYDPESTAGCEGKHYKYVNVDIQLSDQWPTGCILQPGGSSQLLLLLVTFLVGRWLPRISLKSMPWCQNNVRTCQLGNL